MDVKHHVYLLGADSRLLADVDILPLWAINTANCYMVIGPAADIVRHLDDGDVGLSVLGCRDDVLRTNKSSFHDADERFL